MLRHQPTSSNIIWYMSVHVHMRIHHCNIVVLLYIQHYYNMYNVSKVQCQNVEHHQLTCCNVAHLRQHNIQHVMMYGVILRLLYIIGQHVKLHCDTVLTLPNMWKHQFNMLLHEWNKLQHCSSSVHLFLSS